MLCLSENQEEKLDKGEAWKPAKKSLPPSTGEVKESFWDNSTGAERGAGINFPKGKKKISGGGPPRETQRVNPKRREGGVKKKKRGEQSALTRREKKQEEIKSGRKNKLCS